MDNDESSLKQPILPSQVKRPILLSQVKRPAKSKVRDMSVVGFDLGNEGCVVAVARGGEVVDVVFNGELKQETLSGVCFEDKQPFIWKAASMTNPKNTISQIKRLIGCHFSDYELQRDLKSLPFLVTEGPDGYPLIHARYLGEKKTFTPTQILSMVLADLKSIAEKSLETPVVDCCIGIPVYFTDLQRRAVVDAATIAGLRPLCLIHETTATALAYGVYKTDLQGDEPLIVAFVDVGHASIQVCIAALNNCQLKILAHSFDRSVGGRDFDQLIFQHFAAKFKDEYKIDVHQNDRACLRLRKKCNKLEKVLRANSEASLHIECLMDDKDVEGFINRDEFERISIPFVERLKKVLEKVFVDAGLTKKNIRAVELVGSGSRIPAVFKILTEFFGKEPWDTMNAREWVAKGCALQCAILNPTYTFEFRQFQVDERLPFPIALTWKADNQNGAIDNVKSSIVFPKASPIPNVKALTFYRSGTFQLDLQYADASELQAPSKISQYTIGPFQSWKFGRVKLKVKVLLDLHGIVSIESATLLEEDIDPSSLKVTEKNVPVSQVLVYGQKAKET